MQEQVVSTAGHGAATVVVGTENEHGLVISSRRDVLAGVPVSVGRAADLCFASPTDDFVSRHAVEVTSTPDGWRVVAVNRHGVTLHRWGLAPLPADPVQVVPSDRVGLRMPGSGHRHHWVFLEGGHLAGPATHPSTAGTAVGNPPRPLTAPQVEAVYAVFEQLLSWPPVVPANPRQLKQVARRLGISIPAVQARLSEVRAKAGRLGLSRDVDLTDPEYVHVLVRAGYLVQPSAHGR
jgi:hypothetical protein